MKMNMLLAFTVFFSICCMMIQSGSSGNLKTSSEVRSALSKINVARKALCKEGGLPEPADLTWDDQLASIAKTASGTCAQRKNGPKGGPISLVYMDGDDDNAKKMLELNEKLLKESLNNPGNRDDRIDVLRHHLYDDTSYMQLFNPNQTAIGCDDNPCTEQVSAKHAEQAGMSGNTYKYTVYCILGHGNQWSKEVAQAILNKMDSNKNGKNANGGLLPFDIAEKQESKADAQKSSRLASSVSALLLAFLMVPIMNIFL